jgi:aryl-alcohol dehydrogenase-like predicted oxidoreductase
MNKIGLGCWGLGGNSYGKISFKQSIDVLDEAGRLGASIFDLSNLYGAGRAEIIFGEWLANKSQTSDKNVNFITKAGLLPHSGFEMPTDFRVDSLIIEIRRSIERLGVDTIPIFLLHSPDVDFLTNANMDDIVKNLKSTGLIRDVGVSLRSPLDLLKFDSKCIDWVELNYNLMDMRLDYLEDIKKIIEKNKIKIIARTPLAFGFLTSTPPENSMIFSQHSHLKNWSLEQIDVWRNGSRRYMEKALELGLTIEQLAISFCLTNTLITHVIPGAMSPEQVRKNMLGAKFLSDFEMESLKNIYKTTDFYVQKK